MRAGEHQSNGQTKKAQTSRVHNAPRFLGSPPFRHRANAKARPSYRLDFSADPVQGEAPNPPCYPDHRDLCITACKWRTGPRVEIAFSLALTLCFPVTPAEWVLDSMSICRGGDVPSLPRSPHPNSLWPSLGSARWPSHMPGRSREWITSLSSRKLLPIVILASDLSLRVHDLAQDSRSIEALRSLPTARRRHRWSRAPCIPRRRRSS